MSASNIAVRAPGHPILSIKGSTPDSVMAANARYLSFAYYNDRLDVIQVIDPDKRWTLATALGVMRGVTVTQVLALLITLGSAFDTSLLGLVFGLITSIALAGAKPRLSNRLGIASISTQYSAKEGSKNARGEDVNWFSQFDLMISRLRELDVFLATLHPDDVAYDNVMLARHSIHNMIWECISRYRRVEPYLRNVRESTEAILTEALRAVVIQQEKTATILDGLMALGARSSVLGTREWDDENDLMIRQLSRLCNSLDELRESQQVQMALPSGDEEPLAWEVKADRGLDGRLGRVVDKAESRPRPRTIL